MFELLWSKEKVIKKVAGSKPRVVKGAKIPNLFSLR